MSALTPLQALDVMIDWLNANVDQGTDIIFDNDEDNSDSAAVLPPLQVLRKAFKPGEGEAKSKSESDTQNDFEKRNTNAGFLHRYVSDDYKGEAHIVECPSCLAVYPSYESYEGNQVSDEYGIHCPHCHAKDPDVCTNVGLAWNVQQKRINDLEAQLQFLRETYGLQHNFNQD
ncbi:DUF957 domain-containing protein (plasmid) [Providencia huaxiensis]|uniref:DUF957 domain-containing protein n=4 Tax=Enterobacterales TaxID=91347 RepID=A0A7L8KAN9_ECOLX|nr:DUF957 domain-containing protein [Proteus mirabilis]ELR5094239.1 DUF957 domain-containing protein [Providencia rettgeri]MBE8852195.1 DUF957 domain-containing protein [Klebsiella pneumoniae]QOE89778.1 hypothetical protein [Escherichia coli]SPY66686.1 Enterobacterial protein of uncharacterised function (DUF957) [Providencia stuartii]SUC33785.1 Enterobacterial protein of uncharacterised function (DUF957) [Providencia rustigianii]BAB93838.1 conserved hypothetical protein [Proteus vulgaris]